jgi:hypothetical protein
MNGKYNAMQEIALKRLWRSELEQPTVTGDLLGDLMFKWSEMKTAELKQSLLNTPARGKNRTPGRATGSLLASLEAQGITYSGNKVIARIAAQEEWQWIDQGRGKTRGGGNGQLVEALKVWIASKGIQVRQSAGQSTQSVIEEKNSLAFAIARKIHKNGYPGTRFFSKVINQQAYDELAEYLGNAVGKKIQLSFELLAKESKEKGSPFRL